MADIIENAGKLVWQIFGWTCEPIQAAVPICSLHHLQVEEVVQAGRYKEQDDSPKQDNPREITTWCNVGGYQYAGRSTVRTCTRISSGIPGRVHGYQNYTAKAGLGQEVPQQQCRLLLIGKESIGSTCCHIHRERSRACDGI